MSKQFDTLKHPRIVYSVEEHVYKEENLGVAIGFGVSSLINY